MIFTFYEHINIVTTTNRQQQGHVRLFHLMKCDGQYARTKNVRYKLQVQSGQR